MKYFRSPVWLVVGLSLIASSLLGSMPASAQSYNRFQPANGVLVGNTATYVTTAAASSDIRGLWSGTCNASSFLRGDGACAVPAGTGVTSVGLTMPSGLSVAGSPVTSTGTLAVTTTLSGVVKADGSGFTASAVGLASADVTGTLPVSNGGIGVATLTGLAKGNGTSAFTAGTSSDVIGTWSGTCNNTTFLRGDGTCAAGAGGSGANPTATIGLTAVNGVAASFIRSDGAPALSQAIVPTWTGQHTFTQTITGTSNAALFSSAAPGIAWNETGAAANNRRWDFTASSEQFLGRVVNDAVNSAATWIAVDRTAAAVDSVAFPALGQVSIGNALPIAQSSSTTNALVINGVPRMYFYEAGAAVDNRLWRCFAASANFTCTAGTDTLSAENAFLSVTRSGATIGTVSITGTPVAKYTTGSTGTVTGLTTSPSCGASYVQNGRAVTISVGIAGTCTGTSNSAGMSITGITPASLRPSSNQLTAVVCEDNGSLAVCAMRVDSSGDLVFGRMNPGSGFTSSGIKGISPPLTATYLLD